MKRITALVLSALMIFSLCACAGGGKADAVSPLELLGTVWSSMDDGDKFPIVGGYPDENAVSDAPGEFPTDDAQSLESLLGLPETLAGKISSAASATHGMLANNFTVGVYGINEGEDIQALAEELANSLQARRWMCGFPDKILVAYTGDCLIGGFGLNDQINAFRDQLTESYADTVIVSEAPIA